ncbi:hypothetical protein CTI12_AA297040 [Artemisia annua]|uniref:Tetratricopeptide-like helical domain-containing protein n=1 Tax=Artemisia annua TaxID=35608 RepID=A0A2U1N7Z1_ARTAN|nr:hypothetical protein CTI12_AA297040 [Artemisia annua]
MVVKGCLNWSQSSILHSSPQTLASTVSTPLPKRGSFNDLTLLCHRAPMFGKSLTRSRSCESLNLSSPKRPFRRIVSANFDSYLSDDEKGSSSELKNADQFASSSANWSGDVILEPESRNLDQFAGYSANWSGYEDMDMILGSIERKANKVELPFSLRIIQKKKRFEEGIMEASESAYCSVKKAFSSMVFIIQELQSYTLQMREILYLEDLQSILVRVQKEMNASFVWAEVYFKKASEIEPKDAETLSKYASFLWHAKNDLWAAEETFLEAISADPTNSFYTASYAHFLWSTGADDTCFPLESPESVNSDEF